MFESPVKPLEKETSSTKTMELSPSLVLCFLFICIAWYWKHKSSNWPVLKILPLLLNAHHVNEMITRLLDSFGSTLVVKDPLFASMCYVGTCNPRNIEYILKTNFSNFSKGPDFLEIIDIYGGALFVTDSNNELWSARRKTLHKGLSSKEFRSFSASESRREVEFALLPLLAHVSKERLVIDLQDLFLRLTYDNSFTMIFGINPNLVSPSFPVNEFAEAIDVVMEAIWYRHLVPSTVWKLLRKYKLGWEGRYSKASRTIDRIIEEMISLKKAKMYRDNPVEANDLLAMFMISQADDENAESLRDFAFNNLTAIGDTTASGMTWFFWLVSQTPRAEAKILEELTNVVSKRSNMSNIKLFDQEELKNLVYLHAAVCEALRLYPPASIVVRTALKPDVLPDGTRLGQGSKVAISVYAEGRMKSVWGEDCMEFRPERWINEEGKFKSELMPNFFVFNIGPRSCMGKDLAFSSIKLVCANIIFNFNIHMVECKPDLHTLSMFLYVKDGMKVKISQRIA